MKTENFELKKTDVTLQANVKRCDLPKAKLIIVHGMAEHSLRYERFANTLTQENINTYFYDQRGHGKTAREVENLGFFAQENGWQKVVDDLKTIVDFAKADGTELPIFILGHSMGSFISRNFAAQYGESISGLILSGTAGSAGFLGKVGIFVTNLIMLFNKKSTPSPLLDKLTFGDFNKPFKPNRTAFDWLSRDEKEVDKYVNDPFCGTVFSIGFFKDLMCGLENINKLENAKKLPKNLPIYMYSGGNDPVSKGAKQIPEVENLYKSAGIKGISYKIYPQGRHEMLNETNREEVMLDIINWIKGKI